METAIGIFIKSKSVFHENTHTHIILKFTKLLHSVPVSQEWPTKVLLVFNSIFVKFFRDYCTISVIK